MAVTSPYVALANQIAVKHGIDPVIFRRLVGAESSWNPSAKSPAGAVGLTQVVPKWHPGYNLSTPQGQLEAGATVLQGNLRQYHGNYRDALSAYNSGRPWSVGQGIPETRNYVSKILGGYTPGSGGRTPADATGGSVPPAGSPVASIQQAVPALDGQRLMAVLNATRQRVLAGKMPGPNYAKQIQSIIANVQPRQQVASTAQGVGAIVSNAARTVGDGAIAGAGKIIGTPYSGTHATAFNVAGGSNNWESENAVDIAAPVGTPIYALADGVIGQQFGSLGSGGRFAGLRLHLQTPGNEFYYAHLSRFAPGIRPGARVRKGQIIGYSGSANGVAHLHLGVKSGDPRRFLSHS